MAANEYTRQWLAEGCDDEVTESAGDNIQAVNVIASQHNWIKSVKSPETANRDYYFK
jgi:hypothetical protein